MSLAPKQQLDAETMIRQLAECYREEIDDDVEIDGADAVDTLTHFIHRARSILSNGNINPNGEHA